MTRESFAGPTRPPNNYLGVPTLGPPLALLWPLRNEPK